MGCLSTPVTYLIFPNIAWYVAQRSFATESVWARLETTNSCSVTVPPLSTVAIGASYGLVPATT